MLKHLPIVEKASYLVPDVSMNCYVRLKDLSVALHFILQTLQIQVASQSLLKLKVYCFLPVIGDSLSSITLGI